MGGRRYLGAQEWLTNNYISLFKKSATLHLQRKVIQHLEREMMHDSFLFLLVLIVRRNDSSYFKANFIF